MRTIQIFAFAILCLLGAFTATAFAASAMVPDDRSSVLDLLKPVYEAFTSGKYLYAGMCALVLVVALIKRYAPENYGIKKFFHSDLGGTILVLTGSFGGAMSTALASGSTPSWAMWKTALLIAIGAAGGFAVVKNLIIEPFLRPLAAKAPAWAQPLFALFFWIFDKQSPAIPDAEAAGKAAVEAKPGTGIAPASDITEVK